MKRFILLILLFTVPLFAQRRSAGIDSLHVKSLIKIKNVDRTSFFDYLNTYNQVTTSGIGNSAVTSSKIADGEVQTGDIGLNAVTTNRIADNAVNTYKILDSTIIKADLSQQVIQFIEASGGGTITNYPDGYTIQVNAGNELYVDTTKISLIQRYLANDTSSLKLKNLTNGEFVFLKQLSSTTPTGAGWFVAVDSAYPEGVIAFDHPETGKQWVRIDYIKDNKINIKWAGAIGDSSNDETQSFKNAVNINGYIYIPSGKYIFNDGVPLYFKKLTLIGEDKYTTKIIGGQDGINGLFTNLGDGSTIENIYFYYTNTTAAYEIFACEQQQSDGWTSDVTFRNCIFNSENRPIILRYFDNLLIEDCIFYGNTATIDVTSSKNVTIKNCVIYNQDSIGNYLAPINFVDVDSSLIENVKIKSAYYHGILLEEGSNNNTIRDCNIVTTGYAGIYIQGSWGNNIINNRIQGPGRANPAIDNNTGIYMISGSGEISFGGYSVYGNKIDGFYNGIRVYDNYNYTTDEHPIKIHNNYIKNVYRGIVLYTPYDPGDSGFVVIKNNIIDSSYAYAAQLQSLGWTFFENNEMNLIEGAAFGSNQRPIKGISSGKLVFRNNKLLNSPLSSWFDITPTTLIMEGNRTIDCTTNYIPQLETRYIPTTDSLIFYLGGNKNYLKYDPITQNLIYYKNGVANDTLGK